MFSLYVLYVLYPILDGRSMSANQAVLSLNEVHWGNFSLLTRIQVLDFSVDSALHCYINDTCSFNMMIMNSSLFFLVVFLIQRISCHKVHDYDEV